MIHHSTLIWGGKGENFEINPATADCKCVLTLSLNNVLIRILNTSCFVNVVISTI